MTKAMSLGRPAVAALMAVLALIIVIAILLWVGASISPRVTANGPANLQLNSPAVIVPPPTITPLRVGALPTATPSNLAPQPPSAPPAASHQNGNKGKGKGDHKP